MPFMQFIGSLIAVTIVAWIASRLFHNPSKLTTERVIRNTARYCPHIDLTGENTSVYISETGDTAVLAFPNRCDGIAIAAALGDRVVVREITDIHEINMSETDTELVLDIGDFTQPKIRLKLPAYARGSLRHAIEHQTAKETEAAHA